MNNDPRPVSALTIAGSDSGGGAGIQADLKTFAAHGVHGLSAIAALTAQHTRGVTSVFVPPVAFLRAQIDACFDDFRIGAVKIGMLATTDVIHAVADALERHAPAVVILDPVMIATSGATLLADDALDALRTRLLPLASLLTPNIPEAAMLAGLPVRSSADAELSIARLHRLGARAILLKGGHLDEGEAVVDRYSDGADTIDFRHPRLSLEAHGTGCTLASAIAARQCRGDDLATACRHAGDYVFGALRAGYRPGRSTIVVLDQAGPPAWMHPRNKKAGD
jgi:hydroxymethylpyrimidine/phosphomethylpyrimidine kinase